MSVVVLLLGPVLVFAAVGVVVLVVLALTARPDHTLTAEVAAARRHGLATSVFAEIAFVAGTAFLAWYAMSPGSRGELTLPWIGAVPLIAASLALLALAGGELTWPRPQGVQRQANLNPRTTRDLVPRRWGRLLAAFSAATLAVIALGWAIADESGGSVTISHQAERITHSASGFPGSAFGLPQLVALAVAGVLLAGVLRLVVLRAAVVRSDVATDNLLRSASAVRAVRLVVSALALTLGGNLFFGGSAVVRIYDPGWQQTLALGSMASGAALAVVGIVLVLLPAPRLPRVPAPMPAQSVDAPR